MIEVSPQMWKQRGRELRLLDRNIFVIDEGAREAPAIVFLHGFPTASWDWAPIWPELVKRYRLIALDFLGFGFSDKPRAHDYSIMEQADLTEALVRELGLKTFHVLSHDYGDTVAQELLARQNQGSGAGQWLSLCLLNGGLFPETHRALFVQKLLLSRVGFLANRLFRQSALDKSLQRVFGPETQPTQETLDAFWALIEYNNGKANFYKLIHYMSDRRRHRDRWVGALQEASIPLAIINGSADPISGAHMVTRYRQVVSEAHFIRELPDIGHYPQMEAPKAVAQAYEAFLRNF